MIVGVREGKEPEEKTTGRARGTNRREGKTPGRAGEIVGITAAGHELKTSVASSIATNISPAPSYSVQEIAFPDDSDKHLLLVRVRRGSTLYLITKKGVHPVYVRNEDESIPADAARLQAIIASRVVGLPREHKMWEDSTGLYISELHMASQPPQRRRSEKFLHIQVSPTEDQSARLDLYIEQQFRKILQNTFPGLESGNFIESRSKSWYQVTFLDELSDYEMLWRISDNGIVHFMTQVRCTVENSAGTWSPVWSLADLMTNLDCTIEATHDLWDFLEYISEGNIAARLHVEELPLLEKGSGSSKFFSSGHYEEDGPRRRARPLRSTAMLCCESSGSRASGMADLSFSSRCGSHAEPVAIITNQLLRDLGHATKLADLLSLLAEDR